jgi:hypothetical protein
MPNNQPMKTIPEIIDAIGGPFAFARLLKIKNSTATEIKRREVLAVKYWPVVVRHCKENKIRGVSNDVLVLLHQKKIDQ